MLKITMSSCPSGLPLALSKIDVTPRKDAPQTSHSPPKSKYTDRMAANENSQIAHSDFVK